MSWNTDAKMMTKNSMNGYKGVLKSISVLKHKKQVLCSELKNRENIFGVMKMILKG